MTPAGRELLTKLQPLAWWREEVLPRLDGGDGAAIGATTPTWWLDDVAPHVGTDQEVAIVTAATVVSSTALCGRRLGDLLPGLSAVRDGTPADSLESVRAWNLVKRQSANTWEDLADESADRLGTWPNAGRKVVTEIVRAALSAWSRLDPEVAREAADAHPPEAKGSSVGSSPPPPETPPLYASLLEIIGAAYRKGATTVGDALRLAVFEDLDEQLWRPVATASAAATLGIGTDPEAGWSDLLRFDERELRILAGRIYPTAAKLTLDELGRELDITRERVRQLEGRIKEQIESRLTIGDSCAAIEHAAARVRHAAGTIAQDDLMSSALSVQVADNAQDADLRRAVLREIAGPYRLVDGFWQFEGALASVRATLLERIDKPLTSDDVDELVAAAGVVEGARAAVRDALPLHLFDDRYLVWLGGLQDKAHSVLQVHGEPMSREELHAAMGGDEVNFRSMVNAVQADGRFRRLGLNRYGLAAWGGEEYTTIADEIEQAIDRRGGRAELNDIVDELVELFGVSAQSVRSYAASRRFHRDAGGALVIAPADATGPGVAPMPAEFDRDLVTCPNGWAVRLVVDRDVLRGSGRPTRSAIAQAAGVRPGDARTIDLSNGSAAISWRATQPAFGSMRALVEALGCANGDLLFVPLVNDEDAYAVSRVAIEQAYGLSRIALELGVCDGRDELPSIALAIGLASSATLDDVRARLRARRQDDLIQHLPLGGGSDDDVLDELVGLGE